MIDRYAHIFKTLDSDALEDLLDVIQTELQERKDDRETLMSQYQDELDELLDAIENDGFTVGIPDYPSNRVVVLNQRLT